MIEPQIEAPQLGRNREWKKITSAKGSFYIANANDISPLYGQGVMLRTSLPSPYQEESNLLIEFLGRGKDKGRAMRVGLVSDDTNIKVFLLEDRGVESRPQAVSEFQVDVKEPNARVEAIISINYDYAPKVETDSKNDKSFEISRVPELQTLSLFNKDEERVDFYPGGNDENESNERHVVIDRGEIGGFYTTKEVKVYNPDKISDRLLRLRFNREEVEIAYPYKGKEKKAKVKLDKNLDGDLVSRLMLSQQDWENVARGEIDPVIIDNVFDAILELHKPGIIVSGQSPFSEN